MKNRLEENAELAQVEAFLNDSKNIVKARREEIRCGDGRPTPEQSNGSVRVFGGDFGPMLAIMGALWSKDKKDVDIEEFIGTYEAAVSKQRGESPHLFAHTDTHAVEHGGIGCGHARLASDPEYNGEYIVPSEIAGKLFSGIINRPEVALQELREEHEEQGILLVYSEKGEDGNRFTINSKDQDGHSYFVVNMNGLHDHFEEIVPHFSKKYGVDLSAEDAMKIYEKQQGFSAKKLAFEKGLKAHKIIINSSGMASVAP